MEAGKQGSLLSLSVVFATVLHPTVLSRLVFPSPSAGRVT